MNVFLAKSRDLLTGTSVAAIVAGLALFQGLIMVLQWMGLLASFQNWHYVLTHGFLIFAAIVVLSIVLITGNSQRMKESFSKTHSLNHLYRDTLAKTSAQLLVIEDNDHDRKKKVNRILAAAETDTLSTVVRIIAEQFRLLINRDVVVTFWQYDASSNACIEQQSSADKTNAKRPLKELERYNRERNSIFCNNGPKRGSCCHFFSPDIAVTEAESEYNDERPNFRSHYKSVLCVPIRFCFSTQGKMNEDLLGYLQVDTLSRNRLNNSEHLFLLSAYGDQLYNFLNIVRRNFILS